MGRKIHNSWMSLDFYVLIFTHKKPPEGGFFNRYYSSTVTVFFGFLNP